MRGILVVWVVLLTFAAAGAAPARAAAPDRCGAAAELPEGQGEAIVVDDADEGVQVTAYWRKMAAEEACAPHGETVLGDDGVGADGVVRFWPDLPQAGTYDVYLYWPALPQGELATNALVDVRHARGVRRLTVDQRAEPGAWKQLGSFRFEPGQPAYVEIRNDDADGIVLADATLFRLRNPD